MKGRGTSSARKTAQWTVFSEMGAADPGNRQQGKGIVFAAFTAEMQEKKFKFIQRKFPALESVALGIVIRKAAAIGVERTALKGGSKWG